MSTTAWLGVFDDLVRVLDTMPLADAQRVSDHARSKLEAVEIRRLAAEIGADGDTGRARRFAKGSGGARSKASARRRAARAKAVSKNQRLADDLETGALCEEKLDTIADAMESDDGAVSDPEFIDAVKNRSVDAGKKLAKQRKTRFRDGETRHGRQRRLRRAHRYNDKAAGMDSIVLCGDDATIAEVWTQILARERVLRTSELELPDGERCSFEQRLFDAAVQLIQNPTGSGGGGRPSAVLTINHNPTNDAGNDVGVDVSMVGVGPLTDTEAKAVLARAGLSIAIVDALTGQPLWFGRARRHASAAQFLALAVRDHGCVLCGADWISCDAHHLNPWNTPLRGETNIDNLALLCSTCHHDLHAAHLTLERLDDGTWKTRPATPNETPHTSRNKSARTDRSRRQSASAGVRESGPAWFEETGRDRSPSNPAHRRRPGIRSDGDSADDHDRDDSGAV